MIVFSQIRAKHLRIVLDLARLFQVGVERLAAVPFAVAMRIKEVAPKLRQQDDDVPASIELNRSDQPLFTQASQVAFARVAGVTVVIVQVAAQNNSKGAHGSERAGFRPANLVPVAAVANVLALETTW